MTFPTLLPPGSTALEKALEQVAAGLLDIPTPIRSVWSPDDCPIELLPWLACARRRHPVSAPIDMAQIYVVIEGGQDDELVALQRRLDAAAAWIEGTILPALLGFAGFGLIICAAAQAARWLAL